MSGIPRRRHTPEGLILSPAMEDYLKAILHLSRSGRSVATQALADHKNVSPASVTKMLKRLSEAALVCYERYQGVSLTDSGRQIAVEIVRHHRLLELFLIRVLGYSWDEVHEEAELLEHFISEKLEARIAEHLEHPAFDPHGAPIPTLDGDLPLHHHARLSEQELYRVYEVTQVGDSSPVVLKGLAARSILPGVSVTLLGRPLEGSFHLRVGRTELLCPPEFCVKVWTKPMEVLRLTADQLELGESAEVHLLGGAHQHGMGSPEIVAGRILERQEKGYRYDDHEVELSEAQARSVVVAPLPCS